MTSAIICIGNRFVAGDAAGPAVYDRLLQLGSLPGDIEIVDGGLQGLNLLPLLERGGKVVFVDAVSGFTDPGQIVLLDGKEITAISERSSFGHEAGLTYLLDMLPRVCDGEMPEEIALVGIEGEATPEVLDQAARLSVEVARYGLQRCR